MAASTSDGGKPSAWIRGTPMGIRIANVPQDVPVEKEIKLVHLGTTAYEFGFVQSTYSVNKKA